MSWVVGEGGRGVFLKLGLGMAVDVFPSLGLNEGQLIGRHPNDRAVLQVRSVKRLVVVALGGVVQVPQKAHAGQPWPRVGS